RRGALQLPGLPAARELLRNVDGTARLSDPRLIAPLEERSADGAARWRGEGVRQRVETARDAFEAGPRPMRAPEDRIAGVLGAEVVVVAVRGIARRGRRGRRRRG